MIRARNASVSLVVADQAALLYLGQSDRLAVRNVLTALQQMGWK